MNKVTKKRIEDLKSAGEDHEWYPTTDLMIATVASDFLKDLRANRSRVEVAHVLDIGAGDGRVLEGVQQALANKEHYLNINVKKYAIEKSKVHLASMPKKVSVVGTDFHEQSLVDKRVDMIFSNPPYSEYEQWAARIIRESASQLVYLIIPQRWRHSHTIGEAIERRGASFESLGEFDFQTADRKARAEVEIIKVEIRCREDDAFDIAIEDMLPELEMFDEEELEESVHRGPGEIVEGGSVVDTLVQCYDNDLTDLYENYRSIVKVNVRLLKELGVTKDSILAGVRMKIKGLKDKYWQTLFQHLNAVRTKLATKQRKDFRESLTKKGNIDFTKGNILSMLIWISKWAATHYDSQLVELFKSISQRANVEGYKSNKRVFEDGDWRYLRDNETHYKVGFRIVLASMGGIGGGYRYDYTNGLSNRAHEFLDDFVTVANNLGFICDEKSTNYEWSSNKKVVLNLRDGTPMAEVRAFKNGNLHLKVNKKLMLAINVQAGKILGWVRSAEEAATEMKENSSDVEAIFAGSSCVNGGQVLIA